MERSNLFQFIEKAKIIHGDRYDYSNCIYINSKTKMEIICKEHGKFSQQANNHLFGQGCIKCSGKKKSNTEEFIKSAKEIHGNKYNYNKVNYINNRINVILSCKIHGDFKQRPSNHLFGQGCIKCSGKKKSNTGEFIEKAKLINGNFYDYSKVEYINNHKPVIIICPKHGEFLQDPTNHLLGHNCAKCIDKNITKTTEEFVKQAKIIHISRYEYNKVIYINKGKKVIITCKKHGDFIQTPATHLNGSGCPSCNLSKGELKIENILKENNINYKPQYTFPDLRYKQKLKFDFGILDDFGKLKYLVEYNGEQHYKFIKWIHKASELFELSKIKDQLKIDYCNTNNIPLYIIKYNEDIYEKMTKIC